MRKFSQKPQLSLSSTGIKLSITLTGCTQLEVTLFFHLMCSSVKADSSLEALSPSKLPKLSWEWRYAPCIGAYRSTHCFRGPNISNENGISNRRDTGYVNKWHTAICSGLTVFTTQKSGKLSPFWRVECNAPDSPFDNLYMKKINAIWLSLAGLLQLDKHLNYIHRYQSTGWCFYSTQMHFMYLEKSDLHGLK